MLISENATEKQQEKPLAHALSEGPGAKPDPSVQNKKTVYF